MEKKKLVIGVTGASGIPILEEVLRILKQEGQTEIHMILSDSAKLTVEQEGTLSLTEIEQSADVLYSREEIGAAPASGTFQTVGMLVVPCSMKTAAGIYSGYSDNLILRAADVTIKEQRPLVLAAREMPLSSIHLRNLYQLSLLPGVRIIPPMMTFYHGPESIEDMVYHTAAKLVEPFGIEAKDYRRWEGLSDPQEQES